MRWRASDGGPERAAARAALAVGYGLPLAATALATLLFVALRDDLGLLNTGLLYLLLIVLVAARWGWGPAIVTSVAANLAFNFFFVPPLHTFTVQHPANILALAIFLLVAALTSALLARARQGEATARRREQETAILYDLSRLIIVGPEMPAVLTAICERVRAAFTIESCAILLPDGAGLRPAASSGPRDPAATTGYERRAAEEALATGRAVFLGPQGRRRPRIVGWADRRVPVGFVPLRIGEGTVGLLEVVGSVASRVFTADEVRLLEAFADEAALAVDRDRLLSEAARAAALEEADRLKSALLAGVSHDLRTPLTSILTAASSLLQDDIDWDAATRQEFLTSIESQALRLSRLVSNLLDLSRIEGGALRPDTDWYDVRELLEDVVANAARALVGHRVILEVDPNTGSAPVDHVQISQVVTNVLENAAKFAPADTTITVAARRLFDTVELSVSDEGPGIPLEERGRVFEKFYRLPQTTRTPGSGIGLAISKGLVEAHGGRISVEDAPGGGARFVISLPAPAAPTVSAPLGGQR